jgi:PAS domain S-box-containing protein
MPLMKDRIGQSLLTIGMIALAYFLIAKLSIVTLNLGLESIKASPVWPPAGIAVAAFLLWGRRVWLGVAIGAFLFAWFLMLAKPLGIVLLVSLGSAIGATLQALLATYLLRRVGFRPALDRLQDALWLITLAVLVSPLVSATLSTLVPFLAGVLTWEKLSENWWKIWLGDGMGILVVTPVILTWHSWGMLLYRRRRILEGSIWLVLLIAISGFVFWARSGQEASQYPLEYLPFPFTVWAVLRFGQVGAVSSSFLISIIAIGGAIHGRGPFVAMAAGPQNAPQAILLLQAFMGVVAITTLILATAVAERQQVESRLRRSEASLANAQRIAQVGNWDLDLSQLAGDEIGNVLDEFCRYPLRWSDEMYRILGYAPGLFAPNQERLLQAVHPADRGEVEQALWQAIYDQQPYSLEYRLIMPDGTERMVVEQVEVSAGRITGTMQNVTDRRQAEAALRESDLRCRSMFEHAAIGIGMDSLDGKIMDSNPALQTMLGYRADELKQMTFREFTHPEDIATDLDLFNQMIGGERDYYQIEKRHIRKDGQPLWVRLTNSLVRDSAGNPQFSIGMVENISELKQAEERIQLYADIVRNMQIGVIVWHLEDLEDIRSFRLVDMNRAAAEILHVQAPRQELIGKLMAEVFPCLPQTECPQLYAEVIRTKTVCDLGEIRYADEFVSEGIFSTKAFSLPNNCVGLAFEDVSDRKQAEIALQQSEARFRSVAETAACIILVYQGTQFRYINPTTEVITGYSRAELMAMKFWEIVHPDCRDLVRQRGLARQRGEAVPPNYEIKIITKTGEERWIDYTAAPVFFEGQNAALGTGFDVTERKQAEARLQRSAQRDRLLNEIALRIRQSLNLEEILDTTVAEIRQFLQADRVFISLLREDGQFQVVAESVALPWRSLLGMTALATTSEEIRTLFPPGQIRVNHDSRKIPMTPFLQEYYELCQVKAGIGAPIMQDGQMFGLLAINQCSAPRQWQRFEVELLEQLATQVEIAIQQGQLYQQLKKLAGSLEHQVQERTMQLQHNMEELQELNQLKEILLHAVAHDLRTPIMGTLMLLKNLQRRSQDTVTISRPKLELMIQSGERQLELIKSLLADQSLSLQCEPINLGHLIANVLNDLEPLLQTEQAQWSNQVPQNLPLASADALQLHRVVTNLVTNALQHNRPGLQLTLSATLDLPDQEDGISMQPMLRCSIADNGVGIKLEQMSRLFNLYAKGEDSPHLTGIALGLYLCRQIITAHGGAIGVYETPGGGATFWFTLPIAESPR